MRSVSNITLHLACTWIIVAWSMVAGPVAASADLPITESVHTEIAADLRLIKVLKAFIPAMMNVRGTPGINLAIARHGEIIWEAGFGFADLDEKRPMTPEAVFRAGSITKVYTATAVMQLVELGVIGLPHPINQYLPFEVRNPYGEREITIHDLLTHQSGLAYGDAALSQFEPGKPLREALKEAYQQTYQPAYQHTYTPLWSSKVGSVHQYSNLGVATLGLIVEEMNPEGLSLPDYIQKHIMDPLGMRFSQFPPVQDRKHVRPAIWKRMTTGYARFGAVVVPAPTIYTVAYPAGGALGTPGDHIRLLLAYVNGGRLGSYQLLQPETVKEMLTLQLAGEIGDTPVNQGLIWFLGENGEFSHGGSYMFGWQNTAIAYPQNDLTLVISQNSWSLPRGGNDLALIRDFIADWIRSESPRIVHLENDESWRWKTSYAMGLILVEALVGAVGTPTKLDEDRVASLARRAHVMPGALNAERGWNADAFLAGVHDMQQIDITEEAIKEFMRSERVKGSPGEVRQIYSELGGIPGNPEDYSMPFFMVPETEDR